MADERHPQRGRPPQSARLGAAPARADADHAARRGLGGLLAFFIVVFIVVWLPIHTFDPPPSYDWTPLSDARSRVATSSPQNGCYVCHSGYSRPQDVREALYFLYPEGFAARRLLRERPVAEPPRNRAHRARSVPGVRLASGRLAASALLRPALRRPAFADAADEVALLGHAVDQLITYVETRSGKSGLLRYAGQLYAKHIVLDEPGLPAGVHRLRGRAQADPRG